MTYVNMKPEQKETALAALYAMDGGDALRTKIDAEVAKFNARMADSPKNYHRIAHHEARSTVGDIIWEFLAEPYKDSTRGKYLPFTYSDGDYRSVSVPLSGAILEESLSAGRKAGIY